MAEVKKAAPPARGGKVIRYALTLGEQAEIRVGSSKIGNGLAKHGFAVAELQALARELGNCDFRILSDALDKEDQFGNMAAVLLIKGGIDRILRPGAADAMLKEQEGVKYDEKFFDCRRQRTVNNQARLNVVFGEATPHSDDYSQGTVIGWDAVPAFAELRAALPKVVGEKAKGLNAEGNKYHHLDSGMSPHGDLERKIVIGTSLGRSMTLRFYWRAPFSSDAHKPPFDFVVEHGDIYIMSEKATGNDWNQRSKFRLVHAVGAPKYLEFTKAYKDNAAEKLL